MAASISLYEDVQSLLDLFHPPLPCFGPGDWVLVLEPSGQLLTGWIEARRLLWNWGKNDAWVYLFRTGHQDCKRVREDAILMRVDPAWVYRNRPDFDRPFDYPRTVDRYEQACPAAPDF